MKSRLSFFLISGIIILLIFTGIFFWRSKNRMPSPKFNKNAYNVPISSIYIPKNSDFIFHWKINPTEVPKHIETYQDKFNRQITNEKISFIRDSSFKLISLDFAKDISHWVGDYGSFALVNSNKELLNDWIIILAIKDGINIEEELGSIFDTKNISENNNLNNKLITSDSEIIKKNINSNHSIYFLKNKDNILIASNPKIITLSIDESHENKFDTKENYKYIQLRDNLHDGLFSLEISPKMFFDKIDKEKNNFVLNEIKNLISSVNIDKNKLNFEGIIPFNIKTQMPNKNINYKLIDMKKESELSEDIILVDNPNQYFRKDISHPYQRFISSLIQSSISTDYSNLFKVILEKAKDNLLWINDKNWIVITRKSDSTKKEITDVLKKDKFLNSNLDLKNRNLEIWSKISTDENERYQIKENIEAIIAEDEETYIWSQNLSSILNFDNKNYLQNYSKIEDKFDEVNNFDDILRIHLGEEKTRKILNSFYPYILFKAMLGNRLTPPQSIDMSIAVPQINYPDFIKFEINFNTT